MHSNMMRTDRLLTVSSDRGGGGVHPGGVHPGYTLSPPVNRMTDACENITFTHTPHAVGKNTIFLTNYINFATHFTSSAPEVTKDVMSYLMCDR